MSTITISLSGSAIAGLTGTPTKTFTISDADLQSVINWATVAFAASLPPTPTPLQVLVAWTQSWANGTRDAVQTFNRTVTTPTPISMV